MFPIAAQASQMYCPSLEIIAPESEVIVIGRVMELKEDINSLQEPQEVARIAVAEVLKGKQVENEILVAFRQGIKIFENGNHNGEDELANERRRRRNLIPWPYPIKAGSDTYLFLLNRKDISGSTYYDIFNGACGVINLDFDLAYDPKRTVEKDQLEKLRGFLKKANN